MMTVYEILCLTLYIIIVLGEFCPTPNFDFCGRAEIYAASPNAKQLVLFRENNTKPIGALTTLVGKPIEKNSFDEFLNGVDGSILRSDLLERLLHFNREQIFPRVVNAKGTGAYGYFEVTKDVSAHLASVDAFIGVGKKTQVFVRFSNSKPDYGGPDTTRNDRGFSIKFYAEEGGNFDLVMSNFPVFVLKDPIKFTSAAKVQNRNPQTNRPDLNMLADYIVNNQESANFFIRVYSDLGIPCLYQNMPGFTIATWAGCDNMGKTRYVRFRFQPDAGVKYLPSEDALRYAGQVPNYFNVVLYDDIASGNFPTWTLSVQSLTQEDVENAAKAGINVFDATLELPESQYPYIEFGKLTLNRNPLNYFKEVELSSFSAGDLPPGLKFVPGDKMSEIRAYIYQVAQYHRLGVNNKKIIVNRLANGRPFTYQRDGVSPVRMNGGNSPIYFPNSFNGPVPVAIPKCPELNSVVYIDPAPTNFKQTSEFFESLEDDHKQRVIMNIVQSLTLVTAKDLVERAIHLLTKINIVLGNAVRTAYVQFQATCPVGGTQPTKRRTSAARARIRSLFGLEP